MKNKHTCEFCSEFSGESDSPFYSTYQGILEKRIVHSTEHFVVLPSIGQFVENYMLILPRRHMESLAEMNENETAEFKKIFHKLKVSLTNFGKVIAFEHGAKKETGGGCGVYHAHLHIMPLNKDIDLFEFYKHKPVHFGSLKEAYLFLSSCNEYLLSINSDNEIAAVDLTDFSGVYPSQYMRKKISEKLNVNYPWNWRLYKKPEERLISVVNNYKLGV